MLTLAKTLTDCLFGACMDTLGTPQHTKILAAYKAAKADYEWQKVLSTPQKAGCMAIHFHDDQFEDWLNGR